MSAKFESETIGTVSLDSTSDDRYSGIINAPLEKLNYPTFSGTIQVYYKNEVKDQKDILINSEYIRNDHYIITKEGKEIDFYVNSSLKKESETVKLLDSNVYCEIFKDRSYFNTINLDTLETQTYTEFRRSYNLTESGNYTFSLYLEDGFSEKTYNLFNDTYDYDDGSGTDPDPGDDTPSDPDNTDDDATNDYDDDSDGNNDDTDNDDNGDGSDDEGNNDDNSSNGETDNDSNQEDGYYISLPTILIPIMSISSVLLLTTAIYRRRDPNQLI
jgi:hypothetical protein